MEQYLSGADIIEHYNLAPFQLAVLINKGAIPLSPLTCESLLCLTEPESWLHDLNVALLHVTGLILALYDTSYYLTCQKISRSSFLLLTSLALQNLTLQSGSSSIYKFPYHERRETKNIWLFAVLSG